MRPPGARSSPTSSACRSRTSGCCTTTPRCHPVTIRSYVTVDDIGRIVNPLIVEGQVHGGLGAADYRRHLARVLTGRALAAAAGL